MGEHFLYRPDSRIWVGSKAHDGIMYCREDRSSFAGSYYQRELNDINHPDHPGNKSLKEIVEAHSVSK
jgi:hypothetical protein